jgi:rubrerythrin
MLDGKKGYYSMRQVLERSIVFEKDSAAFYRNMKQKTSAAAALDLLAILERQEEQHAATLQGLLGKEYLDNSFVQFPPELDLAMPEAPAGDPGYEALLDLAIQREIRSAEIYSASAVSAPPPIRTLLEGLAEFERIHERSLKELKAI